MKVSSREFMSYCSVALLSLMLADVLLVILNLPLIGLWIRILQIPSYVLYPSMLFFICIGVYSINNSAFDIYLVLIFGMLGYGMALLGFPPAPLLLGMVLSPILEENLRRALLISGGDLLTFVERPISAAFLGVAFLVLLLSLRPMFRRRTNAVTVSDRK